MPMIDRRGFLAATGAGAAVAAMGAASARAEAADKNPFALGVASGDVTWNQAVLWTRLAPEPLAPESAFGMLNAGPQRVHWRLARTAAGLDSERGTLQQGNVTADPAHAFAVHVDVGRLRPDTTYFYRFSVPGHTSPVGRTRTAPPPGRERPVRFAVVNCQNLAGPNHNGAPTPLYLHGLTHLARRDDIDFVLYLGDYIYDFGRLAHVPPRTVQTLDDYRTRYGQYKLLPALQELHRRFPTYSVPDDHEYYNNVEGGEVPAGKVDRFNHGLAAYWEHLPLRTRPATRADDPRLTEVTCYRALRWGSLLNVFLADVRQYANDTSTLGGVQASAFRSWLNQTRATWSMIGSGFPFSWFGVNTEWQAYPDERTSLTDLLAGRKAADPAGFNPVVVSGDFHCSLVTHVRQQPGPAGPLVATEFVNAPMGSSTHRAFSTAMDPGAIRAVYNLGEARNWQPYQGYLTFDVTATELTATYALTDQTKQADGAITTTAGWHLAAGAPVGSVTPKP